VFVSLVLIVVPLVLLLISVGAADRASVADRV
jgi:hypothetical protein